MIHVERQRLIIAGFTGWSLGRRERQGINITASSDGQHHRVTLVGTKVDSVRLPNENVISRTQVIVHLLLLICFCFRISIHHFVLIVDISGDAALAVRQSGRIDTITGYLVVEIVGANTVGERFGVRWRRSDIAAVVATTSPSAEQSTSTVVRFPLYIGLHGWRFVIDTILFGCIRCVGIFATPMLTQIPPIHLEKIVSSSIFGISSVFFVDLHRFVVWIIVVKVQIIHLDVYCAEQIHIFGVTNIVMGMIGSQSCS
mmetsp:Transcript_18186/g.32506  ORF Transcript_18186/g.32506 Transcript_18186/m.32506 type:complete len:257 (-) Transcript_18186:259-1029(-)